MKKLLLLIALCNFLLSYTQKNEHFFLLNGAPVQIDSTLNSHLTLQELTKPRLLAHKENGIYASMYYHSYISYIITVKNGKLHGKAYFFTPFYIGDIENAQQVGLREVKEYTFVNGKKHGRYTHWHKKKQNRKLENRFL